MEVSKNKPDGWIDVEDYSYEPSGNGDAYVFEIGKKKARVSHISVHYDVESVRPETAYTEKRERKLNGWTARNDLMFKLGRKYAKMEDLPEESQ